ncbi:adenylate/guanylate cyclase domain-containing protein [Nanchangia anserum]|uniref:Adenylate/guanylate cyclase domain-containing protein n=1 Tax=Nanchangia anserum TaxID=2692125 RepID=A0A8I0KUV3_9ACTO|nr:adenylate/guanylate cyclase domain-containing protein [Nanchangia anserum]MBD3690098.1 adenylate/guanylate cyclase domain-containing protein [Nanchangia anserum]QOX82115.1 adenylate/guanylate cyclase domain-containing protein [Nanchangia anserum]
MMDHHTSLPANATIRRCLERLNAGDLTLTLAQLARKVGCTEAFAAEFWLAMGFPTPGPDEVRFCQADVEALRVWWRLVEDGSLSVDALTSLLRAQSHTTDRLVLWQVEALVEENIRRYHLDDISARLVTLAHLDDMLPILESQLAYAWRRQMANLIVNTNAEVALVGREEVGEDAYPLQRTLGFVDMVAYTLRTSRLSSQALAHLVQRFELTCRDVISARGGRVVKTIGDAVLWICHDLVTGADIVCDLMDALEAQEDMLAVRASLVSGRVVSRFGDIFGPSVNLASRLVDVVPRGEIYTDAATAARLAADEAGSRFLSVPVSSKRLKGVGEVQPWRLNRLSRVGESEPEPVMHGPERDESDACVEEEKTSRGVRQS